MFQTINPFSFSTNRFIIRIVDYNDYLDYYELCSSSIVTKYLTFEPYSSIKDAKRTITNMIRSFYIGECINFSIVEKISKKVIGSISLTFFKNNNQCELGYLINEKFHHQHVMSEILPTFIQYAFNYYHPDVIFARVVKENTYSIKLLEKNNFQYAYTLLNSVHMHNQLVNVLYYTYTYDTFLNSNVENND